MIVAQRLPRHGPDDDRGAVAILVAALSVAMLGLAAIVVDLGFAQDQDRQAQNAADAAALAAAQYMFATSGAGTVAQAQTIAGAYVGNNGWTGTPTVAVNTTAGTVDVTLPGRLSPSFFSGIFGGGRAVVGAHAQATWKGGANLSCVLCVLGNYDGQVGSALVVKGNVTIKGSLTFNNANGSLNADAVGYGVSWNGNGTVVPPPVQITAPVLDPYSGLSLPPPEANTAPVVSAGAGTCGAGMYTDVAGCARFTGGNYVITGGKTVGKVAINAPAPGSTFYVSCYTLDGSNKTHYSPCSAPGAKPAELMGAGNTDSTITAPNGGAYAGFALIFDRALACSSPSCQESLVGNARLTVTGTIYGPSVAIGAAGNGCFIGQGNTVVGGVNLAGMGSGGTGCGEDVPGKPGTPLHIKIVATGSPAVLPSPSGPVRLTR